MYFLRRYFIVILASITFIFITTIDSLHIPNRNNIGLSRSHRNNSRFFDLFEIVSFDPTPCNATAGMVGTCLSSSACDNMGGMSGGSCASNYGVCCVFTVACGGTVTANTTYFISPPHSRAMSSPQPLSCVVVIQQASPTVCQYRLDFEKFTLLGPDQGECVNDTFQVTGSPHDPPVICGENSGQHMYIEAGGAKGTASWPIKIVISLSANSFTRSWNIKITQISTGDTCKAPQWCLQYYMSPSGTITSFNYNSGTGELITDDCYSICFASTAGFCDMTLTQNEFEMGAPAAPVCQGTYLSANGLRYCGMALTGGMIRVNKTGPLILTSCSTDPNTMMDVGYSLNYMLLPCIG